MRKKIMVAKIRLDDYATRTADLGDSVGAVSKVEPDGRVIVYLNTRWPEDKRNAALADELAYLRGVSDRAKIGTVKRQRFLRSMDGTPSFGPMPVFNNVDVKRAGKGIYTPTFYNVSKLSYDIASLRPSLRDICLYYDIRQTIPHLPIERLKRASEALTEHCVKFIGWTTSDVSVEALATFETDEMIGTIYYNVDGSVNSVFIRFNIVNDGHTFVITASVLRNKKRLSIIAISRSIDGRDSRQIY